MKKTIQLLMFLLLGTLISCQKSENKPADDFLSGTWTEHVPDGMSYYEATLHSFSFTKDSFNAKIIWWTDVIIIIRTQACDTCPFVIDSCASNFGSEEIFIRGKYLLTNDSIYFTGKLCDSLYQNNIQPVCNSSFAADYIQHFRFTKNDTAIIFNADKQSSFGYGIILKKE
jgi:hypothetical protein